MMAPRPMLLVSASGDWTSHVPAEEFPAIRKIYELYGQASALENAHIDAPHNYNKESRATVYRFFGKQVLGRSGYSYDEKEIEIERLQDMLVFHGRQLPQGALSYDQVLEKWKEVGTGAVAGLPQLSASQKLNRNCRSMRRFPALAAGPKPPARELESPKSGEVRLLIGGPGLVWFRRFLAFTERVS